MATDEKINEPCLEIETDGDVVIRPTFWVKYRKYLLGAVVVVCGGLTGTSALSQYLTLPADAVKAAQANAAEHQAIKRDISSVEEKVGAIDGRFGVIDRRFQAVDEELESVRRLNCWLLIRGNKNVPAEITRLCL